MVSKLYSCYIFGVDSGLLEVEVDIQRKLKSFEVVGLAGMAVKESVKRIESAIINSGFHFPGKRIIANLAPAGIQKHGTLFDLPIAVGILNEAFEFEGLENYIMVGELALDGSLRSIPGALPVAITAKKLGFASVICPKNNAREMKVIEGIKVIPVNCLREAVEYLSGELIISSNIEEDAEPELFDSRLAGIDMSDIRGQESAKRAVEISAAGGHNLLMVGPPGTGKTMLAKRLPGILPDLSMDEAMETTMIYSVAGQTDRKQPLIRRRPFRAPHHTASDVAIVGGGRIPRPGEISLAHNGILFLDELQQFKSNVLQVMRQPLEEKRITISRAEGSVDFPARFMLVAALNPSRGLADLDNWSFSDMKTLLNKISGPFLDRIDMHIQVSRIDYDKLRGTEKRESSKEIRERVEQARRVQYERLKEYRLYTNAEMPHRLVEKYCVLKPSSESLLKLAMEKFMLSIRTYDKILKLSRTIADLSGEENIEDYHVSEALQYRVLDRIWNLVS